MKKLYILIALTIVFLLLSACAGNDGNIPQNTLQPSPEIPDTPTEQPTASPDASTPPDPQNGGDIGVGIQVQAYGEVVISLEFEKQSGAASNQYAVWIEDMNGNVIKSLYASRWTADGGYQTRPDSIALWVERAGLAGMSSSQVDAVSGATPGTGLQLHVWDLTDLDGNTVLQGNYKFFVEGTLRWKNFVLFSGIITLGNNPVTIEADAEFHYEGTDRYDALTEDSAENRMISAVIATFTTTKG